MLDAGCLVYRADFKTAATHQQAALRKTMREIWDAMTSHIDFKGTLTQAAQESPEDAALYWQKQCGEAHDLRKAALDELDRTAVRLAETNALAESWLNKLNALVSRLALRVAIWNGCSQSPSIGPIEARAYDTCVSDMRKELADLGIAIGGDVAVTLHGEELPAEDMEGLRGLVLSAAAFTSTEPPAKAPSVIGDGLEAAVRYLIAALHHPQNHVFMTDMAQRASKAFPSKEAARAE